MVAASRTFLLRTTASLSWTCAPVNSANLRPPSLVRLKTTEGWPVFWSELTLAPCCRRSRPVTTEDRVTAYHCSVESLEERVTTLLGRMTLSSFWCADCASCLFE